MMMAHVDPEKMIAARRAGASAWELHERAVAGEVLRPSRTIRAPAHEISGLRASECTCNTSLQWRLCLGVSEGAVLVMVGQNAARIRERISSSRPQARQPLVSTSKTGDSRQSNLELMPAKAAATMLATTPATLKYWRIAGKGPTPYKIGSRWKYNRADVLAFAESGKHIASVRVAVRKPERL